jgi:hypothetical protein
MIRSIFWILASVGMLAGSITLNVTDIRAKQPSPPPGFPPIDPSLVECTSFQPAKHPHAEQDCYNTAEDLHQLIELVLVQLAANDFANAIQEALPTTPQMFPDGSVVYGPAGFASIAARWVGSNDFSFISVTAPEFRYRPLDTETVVAYGVVYFTLQDNEHGTIRSFASAQTELLRRNRDMPRGWEHIYEQVAYVQPLLGDEP